MYTSRVPVKSIGMTLALLLAGSAAVAAPASAGVDDGRKYVSLARSGIVPGDRFGSIEAEMSSTLTYKGLARSLRLDGVGSTTPTPATGLDDVRVYMNWAFYGTFDKVTLRNVPQGPEYTVRVERFGHGDTTIVVERFCDHDGSWSTTVSACVADVDGMDVTFKGGVAERVLMVQASQANWSTNPATETTSHASVSLFDESPLSHHRR